MTIQLVLSPDEAPIVVLGKGACDIMLGDLAVTLRDHQIKSIVLQWLREMGKDQAADLVAAAD